MHVYKFLEPRGWAARWPGLAMSGAETPQAVDRLPPEEQKVHSESGEDKPAMAKCQSWHNRPPSCALRWEGSSLTMTEE
jgi:hypothetical protein